MPSCPTPPPTSPPEPAAPLIDTPDALAALISRARQQPCVAVDTEFVWERTYYANLGVVQVGWSKDETHLIDTVALGGQLHPLGWLLEDAEVRKVFHDAPQDLQILHRATGAHARNVFDTRIAAGFAGLGGTLSLQRLLRATVGVDLPKTESRTNWLQRPALAVAGHLCPRRRAPPLRCRRRHRAAREGPTDASTG